ncbi:MAG: DUF4102 domain-containing protein [Cyanobacteria bacterium P01_D01_bin.50]
MDYLQTELNLGIVSIPVTDAGLRSPQYDPYWDELLRDEQSTCETVGEQVKEVTEKVAPQHDTDINHWVEKYWVKRGNNKYWYYRYMWMEGRKLRRKYLGSVNSARARKKKQVVDEYIRCEYTPQDIITLIDDFSTTTETH